MKSAQVKAIHICLKGQKSSESHVLLEPKNDIMQILKTKYKKQIDKINR